MAFPLGSTMVGIDEPGDKASPRIAQNRCSGFRLHAATGWLCLALLASVARAQDAAVDPTLPPYRPVAGVVGVIRGSRSGAVSRLMAIWGAEFERSYPGVRVVLDDATFENVVGGPCAFGPELGGLLKEPAAHFQKRFGYAAVGIPVCLYAPAVFVHLDNPIEEGLTVERVRIILGSDSRDLTWDYLGLRGEWCRQPVSVFAPRNHAERVLMHVTADPDYLFLFGDIVKECPDDSTVVASVANDPRALGLASIGCRTEKVRPLAIAATRRSEFVPASAENARNGTYPLTEVFHLVLNHDPRGTFELDPLRREFLRFVLSREGQQAVVRAGFVSLTAASARSALAQFGLSPTGKGLWAEMLSHLRGRRLPEERLTPIRGLALGIGDQPTHEQLVEISNALARTALASSVVVATDEDGPIVRCRRIGEPAKVIDLHDAAGAGITVPIGLYEIWAERDGEPTSPRDAWYAIARERERIKIYELPRYGRSTAKASRESTEK